MTYCISGRPLRRLLVASLTLTAPLALAACATAPAATLADAAPATAQAAAEPAPLSQLVSAVDIPYESFTLDNGLTTIVHTDRKSPLVGVTIYYRVGSKHEPRGRTGFAHLFEHLMFGGSENVPNFDIPLEAAGSTSTNGSTWYDRTNYVETVPTGALDLALFMESDRMGHLLGAVSQDKLDKQRGVVQNEKRQGDNQPYGLVEYKIADGLLPVGHPYRHSTIGSMADLDAAGLADVRKWFIDNYGPNNVVLALAGDIDVATARPKVEKWFGDIPRGPDVTQLAAEPVTLDAPVRETMTDQVPVTRIYRAWTTPSLTQPDSVPLTVGMYVLGGLASSRLDNALVRGEELAVSASASLQQHEQIGFAQIQMDVKPGVDAALAETRFNQVIDELIANGPTEDELTRAATDIVSSQIGALEVVGGFSGKGATLAEGKLYAGNPANYKVELQQLASLTPADVQAAMQRWLTRPSYTLQVVPGERTEDGATMGGWGDEGSVPPPEPDAKQPVPEIAEGPEREFPPVAPVGKLTFPEVKHAALSNGIGVSLARRTAIPKLSMSITFDAGTAADGGDKAGTQSMMMSLLDEGTATRSALDIAIEQERLGAAIGTGTGTDSSSVSMTALTANLAPSLELLADIVRNPAFVPEEVERVKGQRLAAIAQQKASPIGLAQRALGPLIYGDAHPYGSVGAAGETSVIEALTPEMLAAEHGKWLRPDMASITVVGDVTMEELLPALESAFGDWQAPATPQPEKNFAVPVLPPSPRLVVIDRPNSPQSVLMFGRVLPLLGTDKGQEALELANEVIGNGFLSRLNSDLREDKGWTYGIRSSLSGVQGPRAFTVITPVQSDRTADSIALILKNMKEFPAEKGVDETEMQRVTDGNIRNLPNSFQTNGQVLGALLDNQELGRPDDYYVNLPDIYRGIDAGQIDMAAAEYLQPDRMVILVVGDRSQIDEQLKGLDMPIEYMDASEL
ncbi:putative Zn-dependent peptidase [Altererythrobacter atlanticus]|uniref:Peptidase M16 inactive domain protein n=1 Tax=Croceibacterium atlanticum TaxID=1267766 RepID=A0A0F7KPM3_9SPHN|nr:pitrilysin family protein [Croceibacterium atlanticum]AKH42458.1 Peptidase M16 inactive domain protein [Croceibacterium atlanticum]MBB5731235.1 putative Zn-dependent peptidase [Croceibacterium atlanticum]